MIRFFRDSVQGVFAKVFIALICGIFVLTGAESIFTMKGEPKAAKVNGDGITQSEVDREVQGLAQQIARMQGDNFDPSSIDPAALAPRAIENIVGRKLLQGLADDLDMAASGKAVDKTILEQPVFQEDGKFSEGRYLTLLRSNGYSSNSYKAVVADDVVVGQVTSALRSGAFVTDAEVEAMVKLDYQTRDLAYVTFDKSAVAESINVTDDDVQAYYDSNTAQFMTEEQVSVDFVELRLQDLYAGVAEDDVQQAYEQHIEEMVLPTQRQAAHILLEFDGDSEKAEAEASLLDAKSRLAAGEEFAVLAEELSHDDASKTSGGDLGYTTGELFPAEFEEALAALEVGQISDPVETEAGLHLIKLLDVQKTDKPSLDSLRPMLTEQLQRLEASTRFETQLELLRDLSFDSDSMQAIAEELGVEVQNSGKFSAAGANAGLFANGDLVQAAFGDEVKVEQRISEVIELSADQYLVMQVSEHDEPELKAYDDVRAGIKLQLLAEAEATAMSDKAAEILEAVKSGAGLDVYASANEVEVKNFEAVSRREAKDADRQVINAAFTTAVTDNFGADTVQLRDGSYAVFAVSNVKEGDIATLGDQAKEGSRALLGSLRGRGDMEAFQQSLRDRADVEIL